MGPAISKERFKSTKTILWPNFGKSCIWLCLKQLNFLSWSWCWWHQKPISDMWPDLRKGNIIVHFSNSILLHFFNLHTQMYVLEKFQLRILNLLKLQPYKVVGLSLMCSKCLPTVYIVLFFPALLLKLTYYYFFILIGNQLFLYCSCYFIFTGSYSREGIG